MLSDYMKTSFALASTGSRPQILAVLLIVLAQNCHGQALQSGSDARDILRWPEGQQIAFVTSVLDRKFPDSDGDKFSLLVVNRSAIVIPLLEAHVEQLLMRSDRSERLIDLASTLIAYAGDEESLRAIGKLMGLDETRFGPLVGRTLDSAGDWRNPFTIAYRAFDMGDEAVAGKVLEWAESALKSDSKRRSWAEAMLNRYGKPPVESDWEKDPIASRLKNGASVEMRQIVLGFAADAQRKREQR
jgi:hypothetical protein